MDSSLEIVKSNIEAFFCCIRYKLKDWKENNVSIMKALFSIVIKLATFSENVFTLKAFSFLAKLIVDKIGDAKYNELPCKNFLILFI